VQLHPVKPGFLGVFGGAPVIADGALNIIMRHRPRLRIGLLAGGRVRFARRGGGAGRYRGIAIQEHRVDDPPHVPQLQHDHPAFVVHAFDNWLPGFGLLIAPDAGG